MFSEVSYSIHNKWRRTMLHYAAVFFVIAIIAALFGFGGIAASAIGIAKVLFFIALILGVITLLFGLRGRNDTVL